MNHLKPYILFESVVPFKLTKRQENFLNRNSGNSAKKNSPPTTWTLNPQTGLVDVDGDFYCLEKKLKDFKGIRFGRVSGNFNCSINELTSLEGAPLQVGGNFTCSFNPIGSLIGAPQEVGGYFACIKNNLSSLEGAPQKVGDGFDCQVNNLTSLIGGPQEVGGAYDCNRNPLTSLEGAPLKLGGRFFCDGLRILDGNWNPAGWRDVLKGDDPKAKKLIMSFLTPEILNALIAENPGSVVVLLGPIWNDPDFQSTRSELVWPEGFDKSMQRSGGLASLGF
jgi:hypothetical protein